MFAAGAKEVDVNTEGIGTTDSRFDEAEAHVERGESWLYREPGSPNPLTILARGWSTGHTKLGEAEFLSGVDRDGKPWKILVGGVVLTKRLINGLVEEWDDAREEFVVTATLGRVEPGEVVSIKYLGDRQGATYDYPDFAVSRKPAQQQSSAAATDHPSREPARQPSAAPTPTRATSPSAPADDEIGF
jgi:hypothetical protein